MKAWGIGLQTSRLHRRVEASSRRFIKRLEAASTLEATCGRYRHEDLSNPMGFHVNLTESQLSPPRMKAEGIGLQTSRLHRRVEESSRRFIKQLEAASTLEATCGRYRHDDQYPVSNLPGEPISDPDRVMEKIRQLYLAKIITNLYLDDDYISFEDRCLNHVHNIYYFRFSKPGNLYYRGLFTKYHFNRSKLRSIAAFLSEA